MILIMPVGVEPRGIEARAKLQDTTPFQESLCSLALGDESTQRGADQSGTRGGKEGSPTQCCGWPIHMCSPLPQCHGDGAIDAARKPQYHPGCRPAARG